MQANFKINLESSDFDFITEFRKLFLASPQCGSWTRASENCDYGDITTVSKDCYMCFNSGNCRNAYFCEDSRALNDCTDCAFCESCELCYECSDCDGCYNCDFCQDSTNCQDCYFSYDLRRCKNCFGCVTLRDKEYCIFNEQFSKEEYEKKVKFFNYKDANGIVFIWRELQKLKLKTPRMYVHEHDTINCTGDYIYHSKNCHMCFDTRHTEDSGYIYQANLEMGTKDSWDCGPIPTGMDLCYDVAYAHYLFQCQHLYWCGNLKNCEWCINCLESEHLFGCNYLQKKQKAFYILNQKVEEDFYWKKTTEIKSELKEKEIYTLCDLIHKDLSQRKVDTDDSVVDKKCKICGSDFKLISEEIAFYKKWDILFPAYCPNCRAEQRYKLRSERKMYKRICDSCKNTLISTFPPDSEYIVYCLKCYWKNIG